MKTAVIKKVSKGKDKGQYRFLLKGANNEVIAVSEHYVAKQSITKLLADHFPAFLVVDKTKEPLEPLIVE